jgi:SAM-dependent methyltransferase
VLYANPSLYDIIATPGTARELNVLERINRRYGRGSSPGSVWLEPACGTGRLVRLVAQRGRRVVGFDLSPTQVAYARDTIRRRKLGRRAKVFLADMTEFAHMIPAHSIDFAFNTVNTIRHLMSDRAMIKHFEQIAQVLKSDGLYIVGVSFTDYASYLSDEDMWEGTRGPCHITHIINYLPRDRGGARARREKVICHLMVKRPTSITHIDGYFDLRTYDEKQWQALLKYSALARVAVLDEKGNPRGGRRLPYQFEVLQPRT